MFVFFVILNAFKARFDFDAFRMIEMCLLNCINDNSFIYRIRRSRGRLCGCCSFDTEIDGQLWLYIRVSDQYILSDRYVCLQEWWKTDFALRCIWKIYCELTCFWIAVVIFPNKSIEFGYFIQGSNVSGYNFRKTYFSTFSGTKSMLFLFFFSIQRKRRIRYSLKIVCFLPNLQIIDLENGNDCKTCKELQFVQAHINHKQSL